MIRDLLLVRHADSLEAEAGQKDIGRTLSPKGYQDATRLGHYLYERQQDVDLMLVSTAQRAQSTAEILTEQMHYGAHQIQLLEELYQASVRSVLDVIHRQEQGVRQLMVVGHNPTLTYLAEYLTGEPVSSLVPGGLFLLRLSVDQWIEVSQQSADVIAYIMPDQLRGGSLLP